MSATARYAAASLALGAIAVWASENAFWVVPQEPPTAPLLLLLWLLYSGACAAGLSAVLWGGAGGWPAAFLGGALMGYAVEGMVLATTYGDFPFNLAWTALAWHGLVTGGAVLALSRAPMGPGRRALLWIALGALLAFWAQYWGEEHGVPLSGPGLWSYLLGGALAPVAAGLALDRIGSLPVPPRPVLWAAPALLALAWAVQAALALDPLRLALPPILALLLWTLRRLGCGPRPLALLGPAHPWEHGLLLLCPLAALLLMAPWRALAPMGFANWAVALPAAGLGLALLARLVLRARRRARPAAPSRGSPAGAGP